MTAAVASGPSPASIVCNTSFDVYTYTPDQLAACGISTYPLLSETALADGGIQYNYDVNGVLESEPVPPLGFDPATAPLSELQTYGIPPEPLDVSAQGAWLRMIQNLHFVTPPPFIATVPASFTSYSRNWAGYEALKGDGTFYSSESTWPEETLHSSSCSTYALATWTGLGGAAGSQTLAQTGTGFNVTGVGYNQAWLEIAPTQTNAQPLNLYATSGYPFTAYVDYEGGNKYYFYDYNAATGLATTRTVTAGSYLGNSAESIVERPYENGEYTNLANFETMTFTSSLANGSGIGSYSPGGIDMEQGSTILANPSGLSGGSHFSVTQDHCD